MVRGIGVDMTDAREIERLIHVTKGAFLEQTFSANEKIESERRADTIDYLATRFAAKEAVFKALAHLLATKTFDFRRVEILNQEDGSPFVVIDDFMRGILKEAGCNSIELSLSTESNMAIAFVVVQ